MWATAYRYRDPDDPGTLRAHVDITRVTGIPSGRLIAHNDRPAPRGWAGGYANDVEATLEGRVVIGRWRNTSDTYYFGGVHLAVQPGEARMTGWYTGQHTDTLIDAQPWTWVRIDPDSLHGVDLTAARIADPETLHDTITGHPGGIAAHDILETP